MRAKSPVLAEPISAAGPFWLLNCTSWDAGMAVVVVSRVVTGVSDFQPSDSLRCTCPW